MKTICKARGEGKTTDLVKIAEKNNSYIVCMNRVEVDRVCRVAKEMNCKINFPITFDEFINGDFYPPGIKSFVIDNCDYLFDLLLSSLSKGVPILAISTTQKEG